MCNVSKLLLSSQNQGKIAELTAMLTPLGINVVSARDLTLPDTPETGSTFQENATLKALAGYHATGLPTLADDSGLCVDILGGAPGVYTARYGGPDALLAALSAHTTPDARTAHFVCHLCLALPPQPQNTTKTTQTAAQSAKITPQPTLHHFTGTTNGFITLAPYGTEGFGYDPVFSLTPNGQTYAQITAAEKAKTSHRARALLQLKTFLQNASASA